jgi:hypothetical protein
MQPRLFWESTIKFPGLIVKVFHAKDIEAEIWYVSGISVYSLLANSPPDQIKLRHVVCHPGLQISLTSQNGDHGLRADSTWSYIDHNPLLCVLPPSARSAVGAGYTPGVAIGAGVPIQCRKCTSVRHTSICKECNVYRENLAWNQTCQICK